MLAPMSLTPKPRPGACLVHPPTPSSSSYRLRTAGAMNAALAADHRVPPAPHIPLVCATPESSASSFEGPGNTLALATPWIGTDKCQRRRIDTPVLTSTPFASFPVHKTSAKSMLVSGERQWGHRQCAGKYLPPAQRPIVPLVRNHRSLHTRYIASLLRAPPQPYAAAVDVCPSHRPSHHRPAPYPRRSAPRRNPTLPSLTRAPAIDPPIAAVITRRRTLVARAPRRTLACH
ncbi:hypothetical protein C8R46DRAFT_1043457 [Mycena filopes]|nr:hypothetical protein C8R46DRAFT_1043457 [Mycena filopes]